MTAQLDALQRQSDQDRRRLGQLERRLEASLAERTPEKWAELQGSVQGLAEELQAMQRRVEAVDERLWQRTSGNELGKVRAELEQQLQQLESHSQQRAQEVAAVQLAQKRSSARVQRATQAADELSARFASMERELRAVTELQLESRLLGLEERIQMDMQHLENQMRCKTSPRCSSEVEGPSFEDLERLVASLESRQGVQLDAMASETAFLRVKVSSQGERLESLTERLETTLHAPLDALREEVRRSRCQELAELRQAVDQLRSSPDAPLEQIEDLQNQVRENAEVTLQQLAELWRTLKDLAEQVQSSKDHGRVDICGKFDFVHQELSKLQQGLQELEASRELSMVESESDVSVMGSECISTNCSSQMMPVASTRSLTRTKSDLLRTR